jgi:hypothetical protein
MLDWVGQPGQLSLDSSAGRVQPEQLRLNRTDVSSQQGLVSLDRTAW